MSHVLHVSESFAEISQLAQGGLESRRVAAHVTLGSAQWIGSSQAESPPEGGAGRDEKDDDSGD
jgi:hypothetical protein